MITENLRDITDINLDLLPYVIKNEFEKVRFLFNTKPLGIYYLKSFFSNVYADTSLVLSIKELDKRIKFNKNIEDSIDSYDDGYDDGTYTAYIFEGRTKEEEQIFEVFQGIYNKLPSIQHSNILQFKKNIPHYNDIGFLSYQFENYGRETAKFITNWTIILNNPNLFEDIFKKYYTTEALPSNSLTIPKNPTNICFFTNNFDLVNEKTILKYFTEKLVEKRYLSKESLHQYLILAFEKREAPNEKFHFNKMSTMKDIRKIFYNYYSNIAYKPNGRQSEYIRLLCDYFHGYDFEKLKNNFNK